MSYKNTLTSYGSVSKFFHWFIAVLVLLMLCFGFFLENIPEAWKGVAYNVHKVTGVSILFLMILRIGWALINTKPMLPPNSGAIERLAAHSVHDLLYLCLIVMPLAGWIGASAAGRPPHLGGWEWLLPVAKSKALSMTGFAVHNTIAIVLAFLITIHILAAFFHHYILKDEILRRMLPNRRKF